jgi:hypothetical protein
MDDIGRFTRFLEVWARCLDLIKNDPSYVFNIDEAGVQIADHDVRLITGKEYLNKEMAKVDLHTTPSVHVPLKGK